MAFRGKELSEAAKAFIAKLARNECQWCGKTYRGEQRGRCVYCEHCGGRLYQGKISKVEKSHA